MIKRDLPPYVYRKGKRKYLYFTRGKQTQRINADFGTPEFWLQYATLLRGRAPIPTGKTFAALIASYRNSPKFARLKPRSRADYDKVLTFIAERIGAEDCTRLRRHHVIAYRDQNAGAVRFANYLVQVLRILMEHAIDTGLRADNPAKGVGMLKSTAPQRKPWPPALIEAYRATATGPALLIFELCLGTGQRIGDVLRMRWNDLADGGVHVRQGKTGAQLWVPLTSRLRAVLADTPRRGLTIVANADGRPMAYKTAQAHVMAVRSQIGAGAFDIHALRHTAASELAALGCTDEQIAALTGHTTARMVVRYTQETRQKARAATVETLRNRTGVERES